MRAKWAIGKCTALTFQKGTGSVVHRCCLKDGHRGKHKCGECSKTYVRGYRCSKKLLKEGERMMPYEETVQVRNTEGLNERVFYWNL